ncbi:hypothetical protein GY21_04070 [Cryobacterium roopkundense]|uniref:Fibronectin type-III domain-containing protein n=1 Tax=Cryobacterium roopkundense TaxID=1001240 RepID=A0A099JQK8_9MICO|nr:fibronectin type III domain-containing protein [Cryobacterium roopkundense]KGJ79708.1 hypothetical protein GY21_04070 [Cryobacterium roopkundense]MBB5642696.1 hypothetical protein [Cryobacterium roopkundense]
MIRGKVATAAGLTVFLALAGTSAGHAYWSDRVEASASVSAGSVAVSQTGFDTLGAVYSTGSQAVSTAITVQNSGTLAAAYTLGLGSASSPTNLAAETQVRVWPRAASTCDAVPAEAARSTWANVPALTGTLGAGRSIVYCVRTAPAAGAANTIGSVQVSLTLASSLTNGRWAATTVPATIVQATTDWTPPSRPGAPAATGTTSTATTLTWAASTDNSGAVTYDLYQTDPAGRAVLVHADVTSPRTLTGLAPNTTYVYLVKARDAVGNTSGDSERVTVTTAKKPQASCDAPHGNTCPKTGGAEQLTLAPEPAVESDPPVDADTAVTPDAPEPSA